MLTISFFKRSKPSSLPMQATYSLRIEAVVGQRACRCLTTRRTAYCTPLPICQLDGLEGPKAALRGALH